MAEGQILIAHTSAMVLDEQGKRTWIIKGHTTAREGHPILEGREHMFRPLKVHFEWPEDTTPAVPVAAAGPDPDGGEPDGDQDGSEDGPAPGEDEPGEDTAHA